LFLSISDFEGFVNSYFVAKNQGLSSRWKKDFGFGFLSSCVKVSSQISPELSRHLGHGSVAGDPG
jgi:hypothetical protein